MATKSNAKVDENVANAAAAKDTVAAKGIANLDITKADNEDPAVVFQIGDRVVLDGLKKMKRLNGRHGVVASTLDAETGRYRVYMDLLDQLPVVTAKPQNLVHEAAISPTAVEQRSAVENGCLVETQGRAFSIILDTVRYLVAYCLHHDPAIQYHHDIEKLKDVNMEKAHFLTATGWTHWQDPGSYRGTDGKGIYEILRDFLPQMFGVQNGDMSHLSVEEKRPLIALTDEAAVAGWHLRIHGNFWVMGKDTTDGGTFLIPDENKHTVYKAFGMTSSLYDLLARAFPMGKPVLAKVTMVPWYGRLVFDGVVSPVNPFPSKELVSKLKKALQVAKKEGLVVERLMQLELPEEEGAIVADEEKDESEKEPSKEEAMIIKTLIPIEPYPDYPPEMEGNPGVWVFRRMDYTEEKNPDHAGVILAAGTMVGHFHCSALEPTSTDILKWLVQYSLQKGQRPTVVNIDDKDCYKRVKFLLKDLQNIRVDYYPPPTDEERAAIAMMERAGQRPV